MLCIMGFENWSIIAFGKGERILIQSRRLSRYLVQNVMRFHGLDSILDWPARLVSMTLFNITREIQLIFPDAVTWEAFVMH